MDPLAIGVAALAAGAILLIVFGLAGSAPVDPVQARLTQLGTMQAKNLEELELQAPFIERTLRPLAARMSGRMSRMASSSFSDRTEKRLAMAGNPADLSVTDWLGMKAVFALVGSGIGALTALLIGLPVTMTLALGGFGLGIGYIGPEFWLGKRVKKRQSLIIRTIPDRKSVV